ncbi:MAG: hypothetical protein R3A46_02120 [Thermomicrobiales bacterium]
MQPTSDHTRDHRSATLMQLLDDLEEAVTHGRRFPGSSRVAVDGQHVVNLIDELRVSLPVELQQARRVVQERQRIVIDAQEEARGIIDSAQERANYLVSQAGVLGEARQRSEQRLREAEENAQRTRHGVSQFALSVIDDIESNLRDQLHELERARATLEERQRTGV